jgi:hypothetical protein
LKLLRASTLPITPVSYPNESSVSILLSQM